MPVQEQVTTEKFPIEPKHQRIKKIIEEINNLPNCDEIRLLKFSTESICKSPRDKDFILYKSQIAAQVVSKKKRNDSTLIIRTEAVYDLQSFKGLAVCSNDTIYLTTYRDTTEPSAAAYVKYCFEYTIRIKKGKKYKVAIYR